MIRTEAMPAHHIANDNAGQVVAFPLARQSGVIRRTAEAVAEKHGGEADSYWRGVIAEMREKMTAAGIGEEAVEYELRAFSTSVFSRIAEQCA